MSDKGVTLAGNGRRVQVQRERKDAFTAEKKQVFLDHLAGCCNVSRAAEAAGVHFATVFRHRRSDPAFGQAFTEALETGYEALEAAMLERAAKGGYRPGDGGGDGDGGVPGPETLDTALAQFLLSVRHRGLGHRTGGHPAPRRATEKELTEAILAKLALLDASERKRKGKARERAAAAKAKAKAKAAGK